MTSTTPTLRFAPSPNGFLHLGHAFSALFSFRAAQALGGVFLLRIEDIDAERSKQEYEEATYDDLGWLGLSWPKPVLRQSTRMTAYASAAHHLKKRGLLYPCFCSRRDVERNAAARDPDGAPLYQGTCRILLPDAVTARINSGERPQWRLAMDDAVAQFPQLTVTEAPAQRWDALWDEARTRVENPAAWGDVVLVRRDTPTSYHLSVVVDDACQGVTHVTRGRDLRAATSLHALLQRLLGLPCPIYCHHDLILDPQGHKLSKSKGAPALADFSKAGSSLSLLINTLDGALGV